MIADIISYGAVPDGSTNCTDAFRKAIEDCAKAGGGYVDVPEGAFVTGTIRLLSHVHLRLHPGSVILGSRELKDYSGTARGCAWQTVPPRFREGLEKIDDGSSSKDPCRALIVADGATHCGVVGDGTIDGRRGTDFPNEPEAGRPFLVVFSECTHALLEGVTLTRPGMFTFYGLNCSDLRIDGVTIRTFGSGNGDGLDFDGGKRITISNCNIDSGDDAISLKTLTPDEPLEDIMITNCYLKSHYWGAIRIGPESAADIRRVAVSNCIFDDCDDGFKIQQTQNSVFEDFTFSNIIMNRVLRPVFLTQNSYNFSRFERRVRPRCGKMRRIRFSHMLCRMQPDFVFPTFRIRAQNVISSVPGGDVSDLSFSNFTCTAPGGGSAQAASRVSGHGEMYDFWNMYPEHMVNIGEYPSSHMFVRHVRDISFDHCSFDTDEPDPRPALYVYDCGTVGMRDMRASGCAGLIKYGKTGHLHPVFTEGAVMPFDESETLEAARFDAFNERIDDLFAHTAEWMELTEGKKPDATFEKGDTYTFEKGTYIVLALNVKGPVTFLLDGVPAASYDTRYDGRDIYDMPMPLAFSVTAEGGERLSLSHPDGETEPSLPEKIRIYRME